jgi:DNA helicase-2/ATP-dependent DNA helicase PcrA
VKHPKWGIGTILYKTGSGNRTKLIVIFPEEGQKKLLMKYAKLKKIKESKDETFTEETGG